MGNNLFFEPIIQTRGNFLPISIITLFIVVLMVGILISTRATSIAIRDGDVIIKSFIYGRRIPIDNIIVNEIQTINLKQNREFDTSVRTNGIGLPFFSSGWFRLRNGERALVFLTNKENVLLMPTNDFIVLFSMKRTEEFKNIITSLK